MKFLRGRSSRAKEKVIVLGGNAEGGGLGSNSRQVVPDIRLRRTNSGSNEESFFETRPWLDSDCEDEFFSVNGDFTSSRIGTPNNQTTSSHAHRAPTLEALLRAEPQRPAAAGAETKLRRLADLLQEQQESEETSSYNGNAAAGALSRAYSMSRTDMLLRTDAARDSGEGAKDRRCCMPCFVRSISYRDRRKHK